MIANMLNKFKVILNEVTTDKWTIAHIHGPLLGGRLIFFRIYVPWAFLDASLKYGEELDFDAIEFYVDLLFDTL